MSEIKNSEWSEEYWRGKFYHLVKSFDLKIKFKDESKLHRGISRVLSFHTRTVTVLGSSIYYPSREFLETSWRRSYRVLLHELQHVTDGRKSWTAFFLMYLSPQIFSLFAILAVVNLWFLLFLLCLLPLPSPGRAYLEFRGYKRNVLFEACYYLHRSPSSGELEGERTMIQAARSMTGKVYYWMLPKLLQGFLERRFRKSLEEEREEFFKRFM